MLNYFCSKCNSIQDEKTINTLVDAVFSGEASILKVLKGTISFELEDFVISTILESCELSDSEKSVFIKECRFSAISPSYLKTALEVGNYTEIEVEIEGEGSSFAEIVRKLKPYVKTRGVNCGYTAEYAPIYV